MGSQRRSAWAVLSVACNARPAAWCCAFTKMRRRQESSPSESDPMKFRELPECASSRSATLSFWNGRFPARSRPAIYDLREQIFQFTRNDKNTNSTDVKWRIDNNIAPIQMRLHATHHGRRVVSPAAVPIYCLAGQGGAEGASDSSG